MEALQARVAVLERQLRDRLMDGGEVEDDRPHFETPEAEVIYRDFWRLLDFSGMGGLSLDWGHVQDWSADFGAQYGFDPSFGAEILYDLRSAYREYDAEINPPKK